MTGTTVRVNYFAAARAACGTPTEDIALDRPTLDELLAEIVRRHGPPARTVLDRCSFLLDSVAVHDRGAPLTNRAVLDVLPPFAGG